MADAIIMVLVAAAVVLAVSGIVHDRRMGELCDCKGDCSRCSIKCRSNERYYGLAAKDMPAVPEGYRRARLVEGRLSSALTKAREAVDLACYWLFNLCAIATVLRGICLGILGLLGLG